MHGQNHIKFDKGIFWSKIQINFCANLIFLVHFNVTVFNCAYQQMHIQYAKYYKFLVHISFIYVSMSVRYLQGDNDTMYCIHFRI